MSDSITTSIGNWIAESCGDLAQSAVDLASRTVDQTTRVDLGADWFRSNYALILPIALTMIVMTFILQLVRAAWRRDGQALGQAVTGTVSSIMFAMTAITFTGVALVVVDALSRGLFTVANSSMDDAVRRMVKVSMITSTTPLGWGVPALVGLACAVGAILYWGMMIFRKVSILVLVILAPLAAAGGPWEPTRDWRRRWIEATATIVFSKMVMTIIMLVGVSAIGQSESGDGIQALSDIIAGLVVMALVLLSPFMIYRFVHWAGDGQSQDLHRSTAAGLQVASAAAQKGGRMAVSGKTGGAASFGGKGGASPQGPDQVPGMNAAESTGGAALQGSGASGSSGALSKATPTSFTYGAPTRSGSGDGGVPLVSRAAGDRADGDQGRPLVNRPGASAAGPASAGRGPGPAAQAAAGSPGVKTPAAFPAPSGAVPAIDPALAPPTGPATPAAQRFSFPGRTPSS
ncbi:ATP-binding protein [Kitasatospora sp. NE20-6]|uniref:SCO6881 family protein n=1 Tax=Kitasatospora sp. NE20-6 TaxID=2859066 RepID=UPI0034DC22D3